MEISAVNGLTQLKMKIQNWHRETGFMLLFLSIFCQLIDTSQLKYCSIGFYKCFDKTVRMLINI